MTVKLPKKRNRRPFILRRSGVHGRGAFATEWIRKGTRLIRYTGERITEEEADARYDDDDGPDPHHTFLFSMDDGTVVDARYGGNAARFINHSCEPNCEAVIEDDRIWIDALRDIAPGEELFYDYAFILDEPHTPAVKRRYVCLCGTPSCRGTILAPKRKPAPGKEARGTAATRRQRRAAGNRKETSSARKASTKAARKRPRR